MIMSNDLWASLPERTTARAAASRRTAGAVPARAQRLIEWLESNSSANDDDQVAELSKILNDAGLDWGYAWGERIKVVTKEQMDAIRSEYGRGWDNARARRDALSALPDVRTASRRTATPEIGRLVPARTSSRREALAPHPTATVNIDGRDVTVYAAPSKSGVPKPWIAVEVRPDGTAHEWFGGANRDTVVNRIGRGPWKLIDTSKYEWTKTPAHKLFSASKTAMPAPADLGVQVGDIFYNSWGYDQTNVDFYEVIRLTGQGVEVQPIHSRNLGTDHASYESVVPVPGSVRDYDVITGIERSDPKKSKVCRLKDGYGGRPTIVLRSGEHWATKWDGRPMHQTGYGFGH